LQKGGGPPFHWKIIGFFRGPLLAFCAPGVELLFHRFVGGGAWAPSTGLRGFRQRERAPVASGWPVFAAHLRAAVCRPPTRLTDHIQCLLRPGSRSASQSDNSLPAGQGRFRARATKAGRAASGQARCGVDGLQGNKRERRGHQVSAHPERWLICDAWRPAPFDAFTNGIEQIHASRRRKG